MKNLLILGGTTEARKLAEILCQKNAYPLRVITALAGVVEPIQPLPGDTRIGAFGSAKALATYIKEERINVIVDATHPYAKNISQQASQVAAELNIPKLQMLRAPWSQPDGSEWLEYETLESCAHDLPRYASRVFLTVGSRGPKAFEGIADIHFVVRLIEEPPRPLNIPSHELIRARPPFDHDGETALLKAHKIDTLVTKNAGGEATIAKIYAASGLGIRIACISRPAPEPGARVSNLDDALGWITSHL